VAELLKGAEVLDETPVTVPVRRSKPHSIFTQAQEMMIQMQRAAEAAEEESLEESQDFDFYDEEEIASRHEEFVGSTGYELLTDDVKAFHAKKEAENAAALLKKAEKASPSPAKPPSDDEVVEDA
jgi:uncharacterized protein YacL (UPF0231 family)